MQAFLLALAFAGILADVFLPVPLSMFRLPFSVCYRSGCYAPAVDGVVVTPLLSSINRGLVCHCHWLSRCFRLFSCHDGALYWTLSVLSTPWLIPFGLFNPTGLFSGSVGSIDALSSMLCRSPVSVYHCL
jgi:hypothetical protein